MQLLEKMNNVLNKWLLIIGGVAVLALMMLATGNVLLRVVGMPFRGAYEIVSFLGAVVTAFALGYTQKRKFNIVVDILSDKFPRESRESSMGSATASACCSSPSLRGSLSNGG